MACVPTPTDTLFGTVVAANQVTTVTTVFTTLPPVLTTAFTQSFLGSCVDENGDAVESVSSGVGIGAGCETLTVPFVSTLDPGGQTVLTIPVVSTTFQTTVIPTLTLFDTCPDPADSSPTPPSQPPPAPPSSTSSTTPSSTSTLTPPPASAFPTPTGSSIPTLITPVDTVVTQVPTTLPEGLTVLEWVTSTRTYSPTVIMIPSPSPTNSGTSEATDKNGDPHIMLAPILGGVIGGFFILIALVVLFWMVWRRRRSLFRRAPQQNRSYYDAPPLQNYEPDPEPRPYEYGLVGTNSSHPSRGTSLTSLGFSARDRYDSMSPLTAQPTPSAWQGPNPTIRPVSQSGDYLMGDTLQLKRPASWSSPTKQPEPQAPAPAPAPEKLVDVGDEERDSVAPQLRRPKSMLYVVNQDTNVRSPSVASVALPGPASPTHRS